MILDKLKNSERYNDLHPSFFEVFNFLKTKDLKSLPVGRHEIDGDTLFVSVSKSLGRKKNDAELEIHRNYIDIQFVLSGNDEMGWKSLYDCEKPSTEYNLEKDIQFYQDEPVSWINVAGGSFAIFFPEDAHLPLISDELIHKIVVKIKV